MPQESVTFEGSDGATRTGRMRRPVTPRGWVLLAGPAIEPARVGEALVEGGFGVLEVAAGDVLAAARWLTSQVRSPSLVVGVGEAGPAAVADAARIPSVVAVATVGAPDPARSTLPLLALPDSEASGRQLAAWAAGLVEPAASGLAEGEVQVVVTQGLRASVVAGRHRWVADEPVRHGGTDTGPNPYDLLLASLGACGAIAVRQFADRRGWPLQEVRVTLRHQRVGLEDGARTDGRQVERIHRRVRLAGPLTDEQVQRLLDIAVRCPVDRTLQAEIDVRTTLERG